MMSSDHDKPIMPSLRTLQVFEAAARHKNFTAAGFDIGITQSAVSRQVADLEAYLSQSLFVRSGPTLILTRTGATLAKGLGHALTDMRSCVEEARNVSDSQVITLTMLPSVAAKWLAPRLGQFTLAHPDIDLRISATRHLVDFTAEGVDAAIRYGKGKWPGVNAVQLGSEIIQPVCSPEYASKIGMVEPDDLLRASLLYGDIAEDWTKWFGAAGLSGAVLPKGPKLGDDTAILQAVLDHQGVALGRSLLVANDLETGRLIAPFPTVLKASYSYWFVNPVSLNLSPTLAAVKDWIVSEFGTHQ